MTVVVPPASVGRVEGGAGRGSSALFGERSRTVLDALRVPAPHH